VHKKQNKKKKILRHLYNKKIHALFEKIFHRHIISLVQFETNIWMVLCYSSKVRPKKKIKEKNEGKENALHQIIKKEIQKSNRNYTCNT